MATFPTSLPNPSIDTGHRVILPSARTVSESNHPKARRSVSRKRESWDLKFDNLRYSDYATLKAFFEENQGLIFQWTNPVTSVTHNVIFDMDYLEDSMKSTYTDGITVKIVEV